MEGTYWQVSLVVGLRMTAAFGLAAFFLLGLPLLASAATPTVVINEIMWDGTEYLELYNTTADDILLSEWTLRRQAPGGEEKAIVTFADDDAIAAGAYFLLEKNEAATEVVADALAGALTLLNTGEFVILRDAGGVVVDQANQLGAWWAGENTTAGIAMERSPAADSGTAPDSWYTSTGTGGGRAGTPRARNSEPAVNGPPEAELTGPTSALVGVSLMFSAEDSSDAEGGVLNFSWSFGDGALASGAEVTHTFSSAGTYTVAVTVSDGALEDERELQLSVTAPVYSDYVVINELLPNPIGTDTAGEFIELKNTGSGSVDLSGWQLADAAGGSSPYTIPVGVSLGAGSHKSFGRAETGIALNNDGDTVRLLDPTDHVKSSFTYAVSVAEGLSYNRLSEASYTLSTTITPGAANVITQASESEEEEERDEATADAAAGRVAGAAAVVVKLADVRHEELGTLIETTGVVSAPPGVLSEKTLYLAGSGIQVYFYDEDWPALKLGDTVRVQGELATSLGEYRLKLARVEDIAAVGSGEPPVPHQVKTGEITEALEGSLVIIEGSVTETSGDTFYVDDGSGTVKVVIQESTHIAKPKMTTGVDVTITGVVSRTSTGYRLLPRFQEDVRLGRVAGLTSFPATGLRHPSTPSSGPWGGFGRQAGLDFFVLFDWILKPF
ncbi:MAG TPA: lamin tail domain-containing protein [Candidatus Andersenbacteria bacterium]|nr:lamin tail domain-containing protein [Candidatus Andersenbacteria bacterium]